MRRWWQRRVAGGRRLPSNVGMIEVRADAPAAYLLHGPGAEQQVAALAEAHALVLEVQCEDGLRAESAREVSQALAAVMPGSVAGVVLVGPLDGSTARAADSLLKAAEELCGTTSLLAWARDESAVPATLRSRCRRVYCTGPAGVNQEAEQRAREVVEALEGGEAWKVVELCKGIDGRELALAVAEVGAAGDPLALRLWLRLRILLVEDRPRARPRLLLAILGDS